MVETFDLQGGQVAQDETEADCRAGFTLVGQHRLVLIPTRHLRVCNTNKTHLRFSFKKLKEFCWFDRRQF